MKGPQIEYLKEVAKQAFISKEYMSSVTYQEANFQSILKIWFDLYSECKNLKFLSKDLYSILLHNKKYFLLNSNNGILQFQQNYDSFSLFYKLVMLSNRFFFDGFYLYFYFQDFNVMFRVNRFALVDIFHKNVVWGLVNQNCYPYNFI
jgi:hypothetical protein